MISLIAFNALSFRLPAYDIPTPQAAPAAPYPYQPAILAMPERRLADTEECRSCDEGRNAHCDELATPDEVKASLSCDMHPTTSCDFERCDGDYTPVPPPLPPWPGLGTYPSPPPASPPDTDYTWLYALIVTLVVIAVVLLLLILYYYVLWCTYTRVQDGPLHYFCCCFDYCAPRALTYDRVRPEPAPLIQRQVQPKEPEVVFLEPVRKSSEPVPRGILQDSRPDRAQRSIYRPVVGQALQQSDEDAELVGKWRAEAQRVVASRIPRIPQVHLPIPIPPE